MARSTSTIDHTRDLTLVRGSVASSLDLSTDHVFRVLPQTATSNTTLTSDFSILRTRRTMSGDLACTYAALILSDDGQEVTGDKMDTIIKAAGVTIEPYWTMLFSKFLSGKPVEELIANVGAGGGGGGGGGGAAAGGDGGAAAAAEPEPEPEEEEEEAMDFDLFD